MWTFGFEVEMEGDRVEHTHTRRIREIREIYYVDDPSEVEDMEEISDYEETVSCDDLDCDQAEDQVNKLQDILSDEELPSEWEAVGDGSVPNGAELRTGWGSRWWWQRDGFDLLACVLDRARWEDFTESPEAGVHVHIGCTLPGGWLHHPKLLIPTLDALRALAEETSHPTRERRGYCKPWEDDEWEAVLRDLQGPYPIYPSERYHDINVRSLKTHGTIEVRYPNSTMDIDDFKTLLTNLHRACQRGWRQYRTTQLPLRWAAM